MIYIYRRECVRAKKELIVEWTSGYKETNAYGEAVFREAEKKLKSKVRII